MTCSMWHNNSANNSSQTRIFFPPNLVPHQPCIQLNPHISYIRCFVFQQFETTLEIYPLGNLQPPWIKPKICMLYTSNTSNHSITLVFWYLILVNPSIKRIVLQRISLQCYYTHIYHCIYKKAAYAKMPIFSLGICIFISKASWCWTIPSV